MKKGIKYRYGNMHTLSEIQNKCIVKHIERKMVLGKSISIALVGIHNMVDKNVFRNYINKSEFTVPNLSFLI